MRTIGIFAWIMGRNDLNEMDAGIMDPGGRGNTEAGKICGMIATILLIIGVCIAILFAGLMILRIVADSQHR